MPAENALQAFGSNRLVDESGDQQPCQPVGCRYWPSAEVEAGKALKVKGMPRECAVKLFRALVPTHRADNLLTNGVGPLHTAAAEKESSVRGTIEQFHRQLQQLPGVQACQCRRARSQRNHLALAVRA